MAVSEKMTAHNICRFLLTVDCCPVFPIPLIVWGICPSMETKVIHLLEPLKMRAEKTKDPTWEPKPKLQNGNPKRDMALGQPGYGPQVVQVVPFGVPVFDQRSTSNGSAPVQLAEMSRTQRRSLAGTKKKVLPSR